MSLYKSCLKLTEKEQAAIGKEKEKKGEKEGKERRKENQEGKMERLN